MRFLYWFNKLRYETYISKYIFKIYLRKIFNLFEKRYIILYNRGILKVGEVMKRLFKLLLVMFILYLLVQVGFKIFGKGTTVDYQLSVNDNLNAKVHEVYTNRVKDEKKNYFLTIEIGNQKFMIQTFKSFNYSSKVLKKIKYYQGNYQCIYPLFKKGVQITDVLCLDQGVLKNYQELVGKDSGLDAFVKTLKDEKKYVDTFKDNVDNNYHVGSITNYKDNVVENHYIALSNYHGIYTINTKNPRTLYEVKLLNKDVYQRELTAFAGPYYMSANYDQEYDFSEIIIVNIQNNEVDKLNLVTPISFNSYIQGVVDNEVYLVDQSNKKQYKINLKDRVIKEIGNENTGTQYYDRGTWSTLNIYEVTNNKKYFNTNKYSIESNGYTRVDKVGNNSSGYIYYYKQHGNNYEVYRSNVQDSSQLKYLFTTSDLNHVTYIDDYVYYYVGNLLKVYHDSTGNRTIYKNTEYEFNKSLNYYVYKK